MGGFESGLEGCWQASAKIFIDGGGDFFVPKIWVNYSKKHMDMRVDWS